MRSHAVTCTASSHVETRAAISLWETDLGDIVVGTVFLAVGVRFVTHCRP